MMKNLLTISDKHSKQYPLSSTRESDKEKKKQKTFDFGKIFLLKTDNM